MVAAMTTLTDTVTVREVSAMLGVSVQHVHRLVRSGALRVVHQLPGHTGAKLLHRADAERLLAERAS